MWKRLDELDRRWIWGIMFVMVVAVLLRPIGLPVKITQDTRDFYDFMESLPEDSVIWILPRFDAGSKGELMPELQAVVRHAFRRDIKLVMATNYAAAPPLMQEYVNELSDELGKEYGRDWLNLGFNPGDQVYVQQLTRDVSEATAGVDYFGKPLSEYPLSKEIPALNADTVSMVMDISSNGCAFTLEYAAEPTGIPMTCGSMQMSLPIDKPYLDSGQYRALIPGLKGAAEYELLLGKPGDALAGMDVTSMGALYVTLLMIIGNAAYLMLNR